MKTILKVLSLVALLTILLVVLAWTGIPDWIGAIVFILSGLAAYIALFDVGSSAESKNSKRRREMGIVEAAGGLLEQAKEMNGYPMWPLHRKDFEEYLVLGNLHLQQGNASDAIADLRLALVFGEMGMKPLEPLTDLF